MKQFQIVENRYSDNAKILFTSPRVKSTLEFWQSFLKDKSIICDDGWKDQVIISLCSDGYHLKAIAYTYDGPTYEIITLNQ